eukprot:TRINITY_DN67981_c4_g2_i1.p1 TRINITY_DN67981_c4_g2~~TRINITY_DN67981_c4_g2_i1.p1  ORF type:complete len:660 (+),score=41.34 TRINITY_DN67981_c4_g2_i1:74-2053(+)
MQGSERQAQEPTRSAQRFELLVQLNHALSGRNRGFIIEAASEDIEWLTNGLPQEHFKVAKINEREYSLKIHGFDKQYVQYWVDTGVVKCATAESVCDLKTDNNVVAVYRMPKTKSNTGWKVLHNAMAGNEGLNINVFLITTTPAGANPFANSPQSVSGWQPYTVDNISAATRLAPSEAKHRSPPPKLKRQTLEGGPVRAKGFPSPVRVFTRKRGQGSQRTPEPSGESSKPDGNETKKKSSGESSEPDGDETRDSSSEHQSTEGEPEDEMEDTEAMGKGDESDKTGKEDEDIAVNWLRNCWIFTGLKNTAQPKEYTPKTPPRRNVVIGDDTPQANIPKERKRYTASRNGSKGKGSKGSSEGSPSNNDEVVSSSHYRADALRTVLLILGWQVSEEEKVPDTVKNGEAYLQRPPPDDGSKPANISEYLGVSTPPCNYTMPCATEYCMDKEVFASGECTGVAHVFPIGAWENLFSKQDEEKLLNACRLLAKDQALLEFAYWGKEQGRDLQCSLANAVLACRPCNAMIERGLIFGEYNGEPAVRKMFGGFYGPPCSVSAAFRAQLKHLPSFKSVLAAHNTVMEALVAADLGAKLQPGGSVQDTLSDDDSEFANSVGNSSIEIDVDETEPMEVAPNQKWEEPAAPNRHHLQREWEAVLTKQVGEV